MLDFSLPQHEFATAKDVTVRAYQEALTDEKVNWMDEANAMQAGIKDKSLALRQKLMKLTTIANPKLSNKSLAQVIIIEFICIQN